MPSHDHTIELQNLLFEPAQLSPECGETHPCYHRNSLVTWIGDNVKQLLDTLASDRCDDPELAKMSPDHIDHRGLLADEQMARAMERQTALLLGRLGRDEPHIGPGNCFADRLRVSGIVLLPFDVGLYIRRWHQPHGMAERLEFTRPMVRRRTGLDAHQARWQLLEERQDVTALELTANENLALRINAMHLKYRLGDVETDCRNHLHAWLL